MLLGTVETPVIRHRSCVFEISALDPRGPAYHHRRPLERVQEALS